jgi:hypothetical protein
MDNGQALYHTLVPLADFKAILGVDDRENALSRYCLITATCTIEQYCKRRLVRKKRFEFFPFYGDYTFPLLDYPVREVLAVYQTHALKEATIVEPDLYHTIPEYWRGPGGGYGEAVRGGLQRTFRPGGFHLQAAVLSKGYYDLGLLRPVGQDLGGFEDFKDGGRFSGAKGYPAPLYPIGYTLLPFQCYFIYGFLAVGGFYLHIEDRFPLKDSG